MVTRPDWLARRAKAAAARAGLVIHRRDLAADARRSAAMRLRRIDVVLDVGANMGQYAARLREHGYPGRIVSFEPIPDAMASLRVARAADTGWVGVEAAVGPRDDVIRFNVSLDSVTSSVLAPTDSLLSRIGSAATSMALEVPCVSLESQWSQHVQNHDRPMLKIDVQGFEHGVLDGLGSRLADVQLIEIEMGLVALYEGGSTIHDLLPRLHEAGFEVISIDTGFVDAETGQVLDIDVVLGRPIESR